LKVILLTGRTIDQGCEKERGKYSKGFIESVSICQMNPNDMKNIKIKDGDRIQVTTNSGSVVVIAKKSSRIISPGLAFIPYGPWVNMILNSKTEGTGMPLLKGIQADIMPTNEKVQDLTNLLGILHNKKTTIGEE
jgi:formylmethanofuran dehydrogenase subunit D